MMAAAGSAAARFPSMRLSGLLAVGFGLVAVYAFVVWSQLRSVPFQIGGPAVAVTAHGGILQGNRRIGQLLPNNGQLEASVPLKGDDASDQPYLEFSLTLPSGAENLPYSPIQFISIAGTANDFSVPAQPNWKIFVSYPYPDQHTDFSVELPGSLIQLPPSLRLFAAIKTMSLPFFASLSAVLALAFILFIAKENWRPATRTIADRPPENVTPVELACLMNGTIGPDAIVASLYELGRRRHIELIDTGSDILLFRSKTNDPLAPSERLLLDQLASTDKHTYLSTVLVALSSQNSSALVSAVYLETYASLASRQWFGENLHTLHLRRKTLAVLAQGIGISLIVATYFSNPGPRLTDGLYLVGCTLYAGSVALFATAGKARNFTPAGWQAYAQAAAFRRYLSATERFTSIRDSELCLAYFGHSLVLDCSRPWLLRFSSIQAYVPTWYTATFQDITDILSFAETIDRSLSMIGILFDNAKDFDVD